ncbi:galanin receptor type 2-like [Actinia tenebrosa]|uniref:Galanin receptor type 2-like n=1 Tax=Actinia tenebrosa TaxID=6105 RepID=A0A6P8I972_ACTTE|nr:galanin receptor type 2-like [Actinia tenebrosa]
MGETGALHGSQITIFRVLFSVFVILNILGNSLVIITIICSRLLKTPMHYLLLNLSIAYIIVAIFYIPRYVIYDQRVYPDNKMAADFMCKFLTEASLSWVGLQASVFTLVTIAFERYFVIVHPRIALGRFTKATLIRVIVACWVYSFLLTMAEFIYYSYDKKKNRCVFTWSEQVREANAYLWSFTCGIVPILAMGLLYGRILRDIHVRWKTETAVSRRALLRSRRRMTKTVIILALVYTIFWLPNLVVWILGPGYKAYGILLACTHMCLLLSGCTIPFVYILQDEQFQLGLQDLCSSHSNNRVQDSTRVAEDKQTNEEDTNDEMMKKVRFAAPFVLVPRLEMEQLNQS